MCIHVFQIIVGCEKCAICGISRADWRYGSQVAELRQMVARIEAQNRGREAIKLGFVGARQLSWGPFMAVDITIDEMLELVARIVFNRELPPPISVLNRGVPIAWDLLVEPVSPAGWCIYSADRTRCTGQMTDGEAVAQIAAELFKRNLYPMLTYEQWVRRNPFMFDSTVLRIAWDGEDEAQLDVTEQ